MAQVNARAEREIKTEPREGPENLKEQIVQERDFIMTVATFRGRPAWALTWSARNGASHTGRILWIWEAGCNGLAVGPRSLFDPGNSSGIMNMAIVRGFLLSVFLTLAHPAMALTNGLALMPPMGWNSWNKFGTNITESLIKEMADAMATNGLKDVGYEFINIDDGWQVSRDADGTIIADPTRFPNGLAAVANYVHSKGLKLGVYSDRGVKTCGGRPGTSGHEVQDANTYAAWGIDYLKYDNCNAEFSTMQADYERMRDALLACGRPIVFSISAWEFQPWMPACGNLWRTTSDISDNWNSMIVNMGLNASLAANAGPGQWNDPDMLEVGNGGMSVTEYQAHFSLWCMMAAPLILGNDLRDMSEPIKQIVTNSEVIAVDQDAAGIQGKRLYYYDDQEVWAKRLGGTNSAVQAVAWLNRSGAAANVTLDWAGLGFTAVVGVRDLWAHQDLGTSTGSFTATVPSHGVLMLKVTNSPPRLEILNSNRVVRLRVSGVQGSPLVLEQSANLRDWLPVLTNTPTTDPWEWWSGTPLGPQGYYRFGPLLAPPTEVQGDFNYTIMKGTIAITGYTGPGGAVTIPENINGVPVTGLGHDCFSGSQFLTNVTIPASVTTIGSNAFSGCLRLGAIAIPDGVTEIEDGTFAACVSFHEVTIPTGVTRIGSKAFSSCRRLGSVTIPNSVTNIEDFAFDFCGSLTNVTIPNGVRKIAYHAFSGCTSLTTVTVPNSVTNIGGWAFEDCTSLASIVIPDSVTDIGDGTFNGCTSLIRVNFEGNAPLLGLNVFSGAEATIYYLPAMTGWSTEFGGRPTAVWRP